MEIGEQTDSDTFSVKSGGLSATWNLEQYNVTQGVVSGGLIG
jgi:hypothetical protein